MFSHLFKTPCDGLCSGAEGRKRRGAGWGKGVENEVTALGAAKFGTWRGWRNLKQNLTLPAIQSILVNKGG